MYLSILLNKKQVSSSNKRSKDSERMVEICDGDYEKIFQIY